MFMGLSLSRKALLLLDHAMLDFLGRIKLKNLVNYYATVRYSRYDLISPPHWVFNGIKELLS